MSSPLSAEYNNLPDTKAKPFYSFQEVVDWKPSSSDRLNRSWKSNYVFKSKGKKPKVMMIHDMQGGYKEDSISQGLFKVATKSSLMPKFYNFTSWNYIDIFVYFSHYRISIPPPNWIDAGHNYNVKVLGSIMTEHDKGVLENKFLIEHADKIIDRLVELCIYYAFDGWFLNFESSFEQSSVSDLLTFIERLRLKLKSAIPHSELVCYDSVIKTGKIEWQSCLNEKNSIFAEYCSFFTDYHWKVDYPKISSDFAKDRNYEIYTGIDIFGRGTYGGGGFDTNVALSEIFKDGCCDQAWTSVGLFAPGWTFEEAKDWNDYQQREFHFWCGDTKSISNFFESNYEVHLPFICTFNSGIGYYCINGQYTGYFYYNVGTADIFPFQYGCILDYSLSYESGSSLKGFLIPFSKPILKKTYLFSYTIFNPKNLSFYFILNSVEGAFYLNSDLIENDSNLKLLSRVENGIWTTYYFSLNCSLISLLYNLATSSVFQENICIWLGDIRLNEIDEFEKLNDGLITCNLVGFKCVISLSKNLDELIINPIRFNVVYPIFHDDEYINSVEFLFPVSKEQLKFKSFDIYLEWSTTLQIRVYNVYLLYSTGLLEFLMQTSRNFCVINNLKLCNFSYALIVPEHVSGKLLNGTLFKIL